MQTHLAAFVKDTPEGREAEAILRKCVHCGFCTATCPTYQLLGDELDGPRGRIYLIKQVLEGQPASQRTQLHLDRCLSCRSCETTCPSGVDYHRLLDIGRVLVEQHVPRPLPQRLVRRGLRAVLPHPGRFTPLLRLGQATRGLLPARLQAVVPPGQAAGLWPEVAAPRRTLLVLDGCVQPAIAPNINAAAARVLARLDIRLRRVAGAGCCGAVSHHLNAPAEGLEFMRRNVDAWWPHLEKGADMIVMTASGCGAMVREYGHLLRDDSRYAAKAARVSECTRDLGEIVAQTDLAALGAPGRGCRIAFHSPCSLQHGQRLNGVVEDVLRGLGFELTPVPDAHLCCGSAGTYSILQRELGERLRANKLRALQSGGPELIATANIGCLAHLRNGASVPVRHWIEVVDAALQPFSG
jgi:glycolate oxidase iron-sulfur subunit